MTLEQHQLILDLVARGESPEAIASRLGRSIQAIRRVAGAQVRATATKPSIEDSRMEIELDIELDEVVDFLSNLPEEGLQEVCALANLQRQTWQLKNQLLARLYRAPV
jgi:hypothetical protein